MQSRIRRKVGRVSGACFVAERRKDVAQCTGRGQKFEEAEEALTPFRRVEETGATRCCYSNASGNVCALQTKSCLFLAGQRCRLHLFRGIARSGCFVTAAHWEENSSRCLPVRPSIRIAKAQNVIRLSTRQVWDSAACGKLERSSCVLDFQFYSWHAVIDTCR